MKKIKIFVLLTLISNSTFTASDHPDEIKIPTQRSKIIDPRALRVLTALIAVLAAKGNIKVKSESLPFLKRIEISEFDATTGSNRKILTLEKQFDQASYARFEIFERTSVFDQCGFISPEELSAYIRENSADQKPEELKEFLEIVHALKSGKISSTNNNSKPSAKSKTKQ